MIPGVDFVGTVEESSHKKFKKGHKVILNGWGVGEKLVDFLNMQGLMVIG